MSCELCGQDGGRLIVRSARLRVVQVDDAAFPGFFRVIWNAHVAEFTDLCRRLVYEAEMTFRRAYCHGTEQWIGTSGTEISKDRR